MYEAHEIKLDVSRTITDVAIDHIKDLCEKKNVKHAVLWVHENEFDKYWSLIKSSLSGKPVLACGCYIERDGFRLTLARAGKGSTKEGLVENYEEEFNDLFGEA